MSFSPTAVLSVDLAFGLEDVVVAPRYAQAQVLVRYRGMPLTNIRLATRRGRVRGEDIWAAAWEEEHARLRELVLRDVLGDQEAPVDESLLPGATIVICTRNRPYDLRRCLDSIVPQLSSKVQALVIDNNPSDDETKKLVAAYPVGYYREDRPGLNWARARAVTLTATDLLLFTDDDVVLDSEWATQMRVPFIDSHVAAVTGAVAPLEFEHPSQALYERYGGFYRGYTKKEFNLSTTVAVGAGRAGAGASMAVRRSLALKMDLFDRELDCGTPSYSGGDFYALYRLIREGYNIVFWPRALAWHRHRQSAADLKNMLYGYGVGVYCVLLLCLLEHRDLDALLLAGSWFLRYHTREFLRVVSRRPNSKPLDLLWAEIRGVFRSPVAYWQVRRREQQLGPLPAPIGVRAR